MDLLINKWEEKKERGEIQLDMDVTAFGCDAVSAFL